MTRIQTAFRLKPELLNNLKWMAKKRGTSLNSLVEEEMERLVNREQALPKLPKEFFERSKELEVFACGGPLQERYRGLDAAGQAAMDKEVLLEALMEKYGEGIR